jgi:uncharacterized membrane protein YhaH (DUF805 family)
MSNKELLFSFEGRIRRSQWWVVHLIMAAIVFVIMMVLIGVATAVRVGSNDASTAGVIILIIMLVSLPTLGLWLWIHLATSVKRLHDQDMSGWMVLIGFVPYVGVLFVFVVMGCIDGTKGMNRFGPSEKYPESVSQVFT